MCYLCLFFNLTAPWIVCAADNSEFYYPAEWETQNSLWVGFRTAKEGWKYEPVLQKILAALAGHVHLNLVIESTHELISPLKYFASIGLGGTDFTLVETGFPYFWLRDTGPIFLKNRGGKIKVLGAPFTRYRDLDNPQGRLSAIRHREYINSISQQLGVGVVPSDVVLEGGAFDVNGAGVVLLSSTIQDRNPQWSKKELEKKILQILGQRKAIWLKQGVAEDPYGFSKIVNHYWGRGTGGHLDQFVRFVNENTVLLAWVSEQESQKSELSKINFLRMRENYAILKKANDLNGRKLTIIKVPTPSPVTFSYAITKELAPLYRQRGLPLDVGDKIEVVAAASYLNFIISNDLILLPEYQGTTENNGTSDKDGCMLRIMKELFPLRKIVQMNPLRLNWQGGGMHCLVQQQPEGHLSEKFRCQQLPR